MIQSPIPPEKAANEIYTDERTQLPVDGKGGCSEEMSHYASCTSAQEGICSPEAVLALSNAYSFLRDRYNKLKLENLKLVKLLERRGEPSPQKKLIGSFVSTKRKNSREYALASPKSDASSPRNDANVVFRSQVSEMQPLSAQSLSSQPLSAQPLSASSLISELEQIRERLDRISREAQSFVDTDLKDMMVSVIPKLKEFERQCSSVSDEGLKLSSSFSKEAQRKSVDRETSLTKDGEVNAPRETQFSINCNEEKTADEKIDKSSGDLVRFMSSDSGGYSSGDEDLAKDLDEVMSFALNQSDELEHIIRILKQQNEKLLQIKNQECKRRFHIPEPVVLNNSLENNDWSLIPNPS